MAGSDGVSCLAVPLLICVCEQSMNTWAAAGSHHMDVPGTRVYHKEHEGVEWEDRTDGQRIHALGENTFNQFFCPLSKLLSFGMSGPQGQ